MIDKSFSGAGLGARPQHFSDLLKPQNFSWLEILVDNYLVENPEKRKNLDLLSEMYTFTFHSVGLSVCGTDDFNWPFLKKIKALQKQYQPALLSEHLCWSSYGAQHFHDLLPIPYNESTLSWACHRIKTLQDFFETTIAIENISSYMDFENSTLSEVEFLNALSQEAQCLILLDLNNLYVNAMNRKTSALEMLKAFEKNSIAQYHVAGFSKASKGHLIDTHGSLVSEPVWELLKYATEHLGSPPCSIEWDQNIPDFQVLLQETQKVHEILKNP